MECFTGPLPLARRADGHFTTAKVALMSLTNTNPNIFLLHFEEKKIKKYTVIVNRGRMSRNTRRMMPECVFLTLCLQLFLTISMV